MRAMPDTPPYAPSDHPPLPPERVGILLVNLGTPDAPTPAAVRTYLAEFLSDRRIVDYPRAFWLPLLHGVILNVRPAKTARAYASVWREDSGESPLRYFTRRQAELLDAEIGEGALVEWAMRYGEPSIKSRIAALKDQGVRRLLVIPLYPQFSATTTASVHDAVFDAFQKMRWQPALRIAPAFHDHADYIAALADMTRDHFNSLGWEPERVVQSFHGLPERLLSEGDPYHCHCMKTARLLREKMGWSEGFAPVAFQSKFGPEKWLGPSTEETIKSFAAGGGKRLAVITPGFVADCLETLEEIGMAGRKAFLAAGGEHFTILPCLNDSRPMTRLLRAIADREASGWLEENPI